MMMPVKLMMYLVAANVCVPVCIMYTSIHAVIIIIIIYTCIDYCFPTNSTPYEALTAKKVIVSSGVGRWF